MNVSILLPFPPSPMYYSYSLPGVEWSQHTIGGDEMLVGGPKVRCSAEGLVDSHKKWTARTYVQLIIFLLLVHTVVSHGLFPLYRKVFFCL